MRLSELPTTFGSDFFEGVPPKAFTDALGTSARTLAQSAPDGRPTLRQYNRAAEAGLRELFPEGHGGEVFRRNMIQGMGDERLTKLLTEGSRLLSAPALGLLDMEEEEEGIRIIPRVMSMGDAFETCFPEQDEAWRDTVQKNTSLVLGAIARTARTVQTSDDPVWVPIADLTGSMARSFFRPAPPTNGEAMQTLEELYERQREKLSPALKKALEHSPTGMYDMDIKFDHSISLDAIIANLEIGRQIDIHKIGRRQNITMPDGTPGYAQIIQLEHKQVCKITIEPQNGHAFSIDLAPRSVGPDEIQDDSRSGPHQSTKKTTGYLQLMALRSEDGQTLDIGVSGSPLNIIESVAASWAPTLIEEPIYQDLAHGIHAILSAIRVELATPSGIMFSERIAHLGQLCDSIVVHALSMSPQWNKQPDPKRITEIIKEGMVSLCTDKNFLIHILRKSGLDVFFRMIEQLQVIEGMSQEEFNKTIVKNPDLANMCASMFDISKRTPATHPSVLRIPGKHPDNQEPLYAAATEFVGRNYRGPRSRPITDESLFRKPDYMVWQLEPRGMDTNPGVLTPQQYWRYCREIRQEYTESAALVLLNNRGSTSITGDLHIAEGMETLWGGDMQSAQIELLSQIYWTQVSPWVHFTRYHLFGPQMARTDLVQMYHGRECKDPFYAQRVGVTDSQDVVGYPPAVIRLLNNSKDHVRAMTITCPLAVNPKVALNAARETILRNVGVRGLRERSATNDIVEKTSLKS